MARAKKPTHVDEPAVTDPLPLGEVEETAVAPVAPVAPVEELPAPPEPAAPEKPAKRPSPPPLPARPDPNALVLVRVVGVDEMVIGQIARMRDETAQVRYADYLAAASINPDALLVKLPGSQVYTK
jgi:hypothetical protein